MRQTIFTLILCLCGAALSAQSTATTREVGVQYGGFAVFYKKEIKENVYRRIRLVTGNLKTGIDVQEQFFVSGSLGIAIGREKRKSLDRKLQFYRGLEFIGLTDISSNRSTAVNLRLGLGFVVGLQHKINEFWSVNLEAIPQAGIDINITTSTQTVDGLRAASIDANLSNRVAIGVIRHF